MVRLPIFLLWLLLLRVPSMLLSFTVDYWWAASKIAVMAAAVWVLYIWFATDWDRRRLGFATGERGLRIARLLFGVALISFGIAHFLYLHQTASLVPGWLPWHVPLRSHGLRLCHGGLGGHHGGDGKAAAASTALQIGLFTLVVWFPVVAVAPKTLSSGARP